jgi:hypothetical protein
LNVDCFATNPKTAALYSKCEGCRPKHNATSNSTRKAEVADRRASKEAKLASGELKTCNRCGPQPIAAFGTNARTGLPNVNCKPCNVKMLAAVAVCKATEEGKAANKRYKTSEKGKERNKRYREGDAGQAAAKRFASNLHDRRLASTAMRMDNTIQGASNFLISGRIMTSPTFIARTGFASETEFLSAVEATFAPGMTFANHGTVWELDHKIPREAYDFDDPEDVKRCWSPKNVHALTKAANMEKSWKLVDQYILEAGLECLPVAWNGKFPDTDFKIAHAAKMTARKILDDEAAEEEQPSSSSGAIEETPDSDSD